MKIRVFLEILSYLLNNLVIQIFFLLTFSSSINLLYQGMFLYTSFDFELLWYFLQYVNKCWIKYFIICSGFYCSDFLSLTFILPDYNLWLRLISQEFTFAIPRTYWVLDAEISNGQSLLPFVLIPKFLSRYLFLYRLFRSPVKIFSCYYKLSILKIVLYTSYLQNTHNQNI